MLSLPHSIDNLIQHIYTLPGIGKKTAQRLTFYMLKRSIHDRKAFAQAIIEADKYNKCPRCFCLCDNTQCPICDDSRRDHTTICVVEEFLDAYAIEQAGGFEGVYHVLEGVLSPIDGIHSGDIRINELLQRLDENIREIIIATNASLEGESTATYIKDQVKKQFVSIQITRIARGLPMGADLEFADSITLQSAFQGRTTLK